MSKKIFVSGASGFQGSAIAKEIISKGKLVVTLVPNADNTPIIEGIERIKGGYGDKTALSHALKNVDVAVYTFPLLFDMDKAKTFTGNFVEAAKRQNVPFVIFNSSFDIPEHKTISLGMDIKYEIQKLFERSGLRVLTLMPDIYMDNLAAPWSVPLVLEKGILPYPVASGKKYPWISHKDLARFVASAGERPDLAGQTLPIGGNLLSGEDMAHSISKHLRKEVQFIGLTPDDFEKQLAPAFGELNAREISNLYRYVDQYRDKLVNKDFLRSQELLSVKPSTVAQWVQSVNWYAPQKNS